MHLSIHLFINIYIHRSIYLSIHPYYSSNSTYLTWIIYLFYSIYSITQLPANFIRPESLLLSLGTTGVVIDIDKALLCTSNTTTSGSSNVSAYDQNQHSYLQYNNHHYQQSSNNTRIERIEWSSFPLSVSFIQPYLVSILIDAVDIHELSSFRSVQRIIISSLSSQEISFCSCMVEHSINSFQYGYICNGEQLSALKLISIPRQVSVLHWLCVEV